jgi:hypothetical protein
MTVTHMRFEKSQTRDLAERSRVALRFGEVPAWHTSNATFFTAFVVIAAMLAVFALALR